MINQVLAKAKTFATSEGGNETGISYLSVYQRNHVTPIATTVLTPSLCLILQGRKIVQLGTETITYGPGDFLTSVIDIPASGYVSEASEETPYIGLRVDFTTEEIAAVLMEANLKVEPRGPDLKAAAFVGHATEAMHELFLRILNAREGMKDASYLLEHFKKELIFRLLSGEYGSMFFQKSLFDPNIKGVGRIITWIKTNYAKSFTVDQLAKSNGMSVSGLHHKFKAVTTMGPLQYQKQFRLLEARRLLMSGSLDAASVAFEVGYESPSQFTREYKRLFGLSPLRDVRAQRQVGT